MVLGCVLCVGLFVFFDVFCVFCCGVVLWVDLVGWCGEGDGGVVIDGRLCLIWWGLFEGG